MRRFMRPSISVDLDAAVRPLRPLGLGLGAARIVVNGDLHVRRCRRAEQRRPQQAVGVVHLAGREHPFNELAEAEKINPSYLTRIYRLTLLAPDIVEVILDGRQPRTLQLADLMDDMPVEWERQRERFCRRRILEGAASVDPWSGGAGCKCLVHSAAASG